MHANRTYRKDDEVANAREHFQHEFDTPWHDSAELGEGGLCEGRAEVKRVRVRVRLKHYYNGTNPPTFANVACAKGY